MVDQAIRNGEHICGLQAGKEHAMPDVTFYIDICCTSPTCVEASTRGFSFNVDEPEQLGGTNTGPNPVEYVIGAYGGCLNVVGHMVAKEMGITLDSLGIHIEGDIDPSGFMGKNPDVRAGYKEVRVKLSVQSSASREQLEEWMNTMNKRCPVGDNLKNPTPVTYSLDTTGQSCAT